LVTRPEVEVGSTANSYEILAKLATGGMAEIFLARGASSAGIERYVVLKRVLRHRAHDETFVRMFLDEARLAAQLQHPNIAQVYDIGKLGDSYFFTMEYVHGETVRALLQRAHALKSPAPIASVLTIIVGAAAGLHHAHERNGFDGQPLGIVHRDVSPSNLMVGYEGTIKVVDFGVAKAAHRSQETRSGTVKGKIGYLSPEQCRGMAIDRRSDLFSLGVVLWEMLTTERLYKRGTDFENMAAIVNEATPPPSSRHAGVPAELDAVTLRLLAKDPAARFQTAAELHESLEQLAVKLGLALSASGLARYLRDVFGQRPEPWIEMQSRETHPEVFTVTSEPIPLDLNLEPSDALDIKFEHVPDLSSPSGESSLKLVPDGPPSVQLEDAERASEANPTQLTPTTPKPRPLSSRPSEPVPVVMDGYPRYQPPSEESRAPTWSRPRIVIAAALAVGVVLGIALAFRGGNHEPEKQPPHVAAAVAAAPVPVAPPDASIERVAPFDAAPEGAPQVAAVPVHSHTPSRPRDRNHDHATSTASNDDVARLMQEGRFGDAVSACAAASSLAGQKAVDCVLAACQAKREAQARKWLENTGAKRATVVARCRGLGVSLERPKDEHPKDDCVADPMSCQH
jgi:serine/threonine protein kinase